ncbi:MAG: Glutaredoxin and related proteins, partial [uncultured Rubrobacteraceae bacterium]
GRFGGALHRGGLRVQRGGPRGSGVARRRVRRVRRGERPRSARADARHHRWQPDRPRHSGRRQAGPNRLDGPRVRGV